MCDILDEMRNEAGLPEIPTTLLLCFNKTVFYGLVHTPDELKLYVFPSIILVPRVIDPDPGSR